jgi:hypothetical protein
VCVCVCVYRWMNTCSVSINRGRQWKSRKALSGVVESPSVVGARGERHLGKAGGSGNPPGHEGFN